MKTFGEALNEFKHRKDVPGEDARIRDAVARMGTILDEIQDSGDSMMFVTCGIRHCIHGVTDPVLLSEIICFGMYCMQQGVMIGIEMEKQE